MSSTPPSDGAAGPSLLRMASPLVVSFWMRAAFALVDTVYAAALGDAAVGAIGLTVPLEFLMIAVWVGLSTGLTSVLSRTLGASRRADPTPVLRAARRLVLAAGVPFLILGAGLALWGGHLELPADLAADFRVYAGTLLGGGALTFFWSVIPDSVVKAHLDTRSTMWAGVLSNLLNLALNTLFVFGFHWGVFGIALSTVLGRLGGLAYAMHRARVLEARRFGGMDPAPLELSSPIRAILSLSVPAALSFALLASETAVVNALLAGLSEAKEAIAAFSIFYRVVLFLMNPVIAVSVALLPYAANLLGRGRLEEAARGFRRASAAALLYALAGVSAVVLPSAGAVAEALGESPVTVHLAASALLWAPLFCAAGAPFLLCKSMFEAMGRGRPGLWMSVVRYGLATPAAAWAGLRVAPLLEIDPLTGLLAGLLAAALLSSSLFAVWLGAVLGSESKDDSGGGSLAQRRGPWQTRGGSP